MSEWEEKLNTLLSDPDAMAQVMNMAQNLSQQMGQSGSESRVFSFSSHSLIVTPSRGFYFFALSLMRFIMAMPSGLFIRFESIAANSFVLPAAAFCAA